MFGLTRRDVKIATIFTVVEILTLTGWLALLNINVSDAAGVSAIGFLSVGLFVEHLISRLKG